MVCGVLALTVGSVLSLTLMSDGVLPQIPDSTALKRKSSNQQMQMSHLVKSLNSTVDILHEPVSGSINECLMRKSKTTMAELGLKSSVARSSFT